MCIRVRELAGVHVVSATLTEGRAQVLKYDYKQHYHVHYDFFDPKMYPGDKRWASGHNRFLSVRTMRTSIREEPAHHGVW